MITLTDQSRAREDRDHAHAAGLAELAKASPDRCLAAYFFRAADDHAPLTCRQLLEQVGLAFTSLPRADGEIANPWETGR